MPRKTSVVSMVCHSSMAVALFALVTLGVSAPAHAAGTFDAAASNSAAITTVIVVSILMTIGITVFSLMAKKRGAINSDIPTPDEPDPDD